MCRRSEENVGGIQQEGRNVAGAAKGGEENNWESAGADGAEIS